MLRECIASTREDPGDLVESAGEKLGDGSGDMLAKRFVAR